MEGRQAVSELNVGAWKGDKLNELKVLVAPQDGNGLFLLFFLEMGFFLK
jgi:hypothetical protein